MLTGVLRSRCGPMGVFVRTPRRGSRRVPARDARRIPHHEVSRAESPRGFPRIRVKIVGTSGKRTCHARLDAETPRAPDRRRPLGRARANRRDPGGHSNDHRCGRSRQSAPTRPAALTALPPAPRPRPPVVLPRQPRCPSGRPPKAVRSGLPPAACRPAFGFARRPRVRIRQATTVLFESRQEHASHAHINHPRAWGDPLFQDPMGRSRSAAPSFGLWITRLASARKVLTVESPRYHCPEGLRPPRHPASHCPEDFLSVEEPRIPARPRRPRPPHPHPGLATDHRPNHARNMPVMLKQTTNVPGGPPVSGSHGAITQRSPLVRAVDNSALAQISRCHPVGETPATPNRRHASHPQAVTRPPRRSATHPPTPISDTSVAFNQ
ncbi:hypothetical protein FHU37_002365 [Allostreptomyces psammosilenae]|uniref:Uncharacterized protein n=1 Tax=Allostreptomyces psammosilenae TaxID=1892865 RepID=A0A853A4J5_9ACTN|nr:hypothetical protein [Allostreptomyces psammosilenae]